MAKDTPLKPWRLDTLVVSSGRPDRVPGGPINTPIELSSIFHHGGEIAYARDSNATQESLEDILGDLEGGTARVFSSGMGAISAVIDSLAQNSKIVVPRDSYSGTRHLLTELASQGRIRWVGVDITDQENVLENCKDGDLLWIESPTNPLLNIANIAELCSIAHKLGAMAVVDNTFATPLVQRPLSLGADLVVHSATKYISGHSDVLGGAVITRDQEWVRKVTTRRSVGGAVLGAFEAFLLTRGIRTLALRIEKSQSNALLLARRLEGHDKVTRVRYPGLVSHPGHELAKAQMTGFGSIVSFELCGGESDAARDGAERLCSAVKLCTDATSLGGVETLLERRKRWDYEDFTRP